MWASRIFYTCHSLPVCHSRENGNPRGKLQSKSNNVMPYFVYILSSQKNGTLYTGVTNDLIKRDYEHKNDHAEGFTKKYRVHTLVYFEEFENIAEAILREKRIKKFKRAWKIELIEKNNGGWRDLYESLL